MKPSKLCCVFSFVFVFMLLGCSSDLSKYEQSKPTLDIQEYFNGQIIAWGMVQDYSNKVQRRFCVEINGTWQGQKGVLDESFYFNDGEVSTRTWQLTKLANGKYQGSADDVVGTAYGKQVGFAFQWEYQLLVPVDGEVYELSLDDWMYLVDEYRVFNRTEMKKLGITVGEVTLFFDKQTPHKKCQ